MQKKKLFQIPVLNHQAVSRVNALECTECRPDIFLLKLLKYGYKSRLSRGDKENLWAEDKTENIVHKTHLFFVNVLGEEIQFYKKIRLLQFLLIPTKD